MFAFEGRKNSLHSPLESSFIENNASAITENTNFYDSCHHIEILLEALAKSLPDIYNITVYKHLK